MLGSASIKLIVSDGGSERSVIFSGDLGPRGVVILRQYEPFHHGDLVFLESTYGDHDHRPFNDTVREFETIVKDAITSGGRVLVPTFAVGRAQLLVSLLGRMFRNKTIRPFPIFLDSPMAVEAINIYAKHREIFDDRMKRFIEQRPLRADLASLKATVSPQDSMEINNHEGVCLIMAGAGMCNAGRILHHLKQNLWRKEAHVLIVGYQGHGSLGRRLVEGEPIVTIHGERILVRAKIHTLSGFSAHSGQSDLLHWLGHIAPSNPRVLLTHGEDGPRKTLAGLIHKKFNLRTALPRMGEVIEI
jgi:metallo-beta-lactamase family protein